MSVSAHDFGLCGCFIIRRARQQRIGIKNLGFHSQSPAKTAQSSKAQWQYNGHLGLTSVIALFIWLLMNCLTTAHRAISFYTPLPVRDYWRVVENLPAYQGFHLGVLWTQNNEHRIVFP